MTLGGRASGGFTVLWIARAPLLPWPREASPTVITLLSPPMLGHRSLRRVA